MMRALVPAALAGILLAVTAAPALAQETLHYEVVVHATDVHTVPVPGQDRQVGVAAFSGLAIFDDGRIASHRYAGGFDFVAGSGRFHGYALWAFEDGSQLTSSYVGKATATADGGISFERSHDDLAGPAPTPASRATAASPAGASIIWTMAATPTSAAR